MFSICDLRASCRTLQATLDAAVPEIAARPTVAEDHDAIALQYTAPSVGNRLRIYPRRFRMDQESSPLSA